VLRYRCLRRYRHHAGAGRGTGSLFFE